MNHKARMYKNKGKIFTSITYYWYGLEKEETIRGKWNATLLLTSIVHYNYLPLPHPWTIKIALSIISYQPKTTRKAHNGGGGMGQIGISHIKRVKEIHGTLGGRKHPLMVLSSFTKMFNWSKATRGLIRVANQLSTCSLQILIGQPKTTIHFQCFLNPHHFGPLLEGQINFQGIMVESSSIEWMRCRPLSYYHWRCSKSEMPKRHHNAKVVTHLVAHVFLVA